jgi:uncharacterized protein with HEPN domain
VSSTRRDAESIADIIHASRTIATFLHGITKDQFFTDLRTQSAVLHQLLIVGEAVKRLTPSFRATHGDIPWQRIAGTRDHLIHGYDSVDIDLIWLAVSEKLPLLLTRLETLDTT